MCVCVCVCEGGWKAAFCTKKRVFVRYISRKKKRYFFSYQMETLVEFSTCSSFVLSFGNF